MAATVLGVAEDPWLDDEELAAWRPVGAMLVLLPPRLDDAVAHAAAVRSRVVDVRGAEQLAAFGEASAVIVDRLQPGGPPPER